MKNLQIKNQMIIPNFIGWRINKALQKRTSYKGINPAQSICFICNVEDRTARDLFLQISFDLKKRNKNITLVYFFDGSKKKFEKTFPDLVDFDVITTSDFSLFAGIKREKGQIIIEKSFDILCNFDITKSRLCHLLSAQANAKFKIGIDLNETEIYDLLIDREKNPSVKKLITDLKEVMSSVFSNQLSMG